MHKKLRITCTQIHNFPKKKANALKFGKHLILCFSDKDTQFHSISRNCLVCTFDPSGYVSKFDFPNLLKSQNRVFGCSQKFSNACNHHGCSGTRRSESSSS